MSRPVIAIVGRPNVGKSTLFNRMIGKRKAIVDDQPGITRDRNFGTVSWSGQQFDIIDTGGYLPESKALIDKAVREQVEIAVTQSDLIMMVVDARTGITETDEQMAQILRRSDKQVLLVVNKIDDARSEPEVGQFFNLGLGEPVPVSAMTGRQSGDMLDRVLEKIAACQDSHDQDDFIKLAVIGRENVGKSSLVNTLLEQTRSIVTDIPGTTRDSIDSVFKYQKRNYLLIDTAGLKRKGKIKENVLFYSNLRTYRSIQRADVVLYMVDIKDGLSRHDQLLISEAVKERKGIVLVLNKWDLIEKDDRTIGRFRREISDRLGTMRYIPLIFTSVTKKQRLYKAIDLATEVYQECNKRIPTAALNEFFLPLVEKNSPPAVKGKEIRINYVAQVKTSPPLFVFYSNHPKLIVDSYKRFLENKLRDQYGFKGVPVLFSFRKK